MREVILTYPPIRPFPFDFPNKGKFRKWSASWEPEGFSDEPQYRGQTPLIYPEDASYLEIQLGGYFDPPQPHN